MRIGVRENYAMREIIWFRREECFDVAGMVAISLRAIIRFDKLESQRHDERINLDSFLKFRNSEVVVTEHAVQVRESPVCPGRPQLHGTVVHE